MHTLHICAFVYAYRCAYVCIHTSYMCVFVCIYCVFLSISYLEKI